MMSRSRAVAMITALLLGGCATVASQNDERRLTTTMSLTPLSQAAVNRRKTKAAANPLGSDDNPVRADGARGQRASLTRLRCPNGRATIVERPGNAGEGVYGTIVDAYGVTCAVGAAAAAIMDLYHSGHVEAAAVPGSTIVAPG